MNFEDILAVATVSDAQVMLRGWVRTERQRLCWTQSELSRRSGVPAATISRLEQTGLSSTEALFRILFALNRLDAFVDFLKERKRLADLPTSLSEDTRRGPVLRVRVRKGRT